MMPLHEPPCDGAAAASCSPSMFLAGGCDGSRDHVPINFLLLFHVQSVRILCRLTVTLLVTFAPEAEGVYHTVVLLFVTLIRVYRPGCWSTKRGV